MAASLKEPPSPHLHTKYLVLTLLQTHLFFRWSLPLTVLPQPRLLHIYHGMCFSAAPVRENSTEARLPLGEQTHSDSLRGKKNLKVFKLFN